ncbi:hypothetical protein BKA82DRAFT_2557838 [Pisolithus tinctorius]|nr:hypothetical protein BKA82DRAFT_2557838 [Pisolithus tinctorius]
MFILFLLNTIQGCTCTSISNLCRCPQWNVEIRKCAIEPLGPAHSQLFLAIEEGRRVLYRHRCRALGQSRIIRDPLTGSGAGCGVLSACVSDPVLDCRP